MESIGGLPAHPLFVHAPVVLMPLAALVMLVLAFKPTWRHWVGFSLPLAAMVILVFTQLAISSGEEFSEIVPVNTDDHEALAITTRNLIGLFAICSLVLVILERRRVQENQPRWLGPAVLIMVAATTLSSVLATVWMVRTGDEGARLVWENVLRIGIGH